MKQFLFSRRENKGHKEKRDRKQDAPCIQTAEQCRFFEAHGAVVLCTNYVRVKIRNNQQEVCEENQAFLMQENACGRNMPILQAHKVEVEQVSASKLVSPICFNQRHRPKFSKDVPKPFSYFIYSTATLTLGVFFKHSLCTLI